MKNLLFTGASGFLGSNIIEFLKQIYTVDTLGITDSDTYNVNLVTDIPTLKKDYSIVLHAAGKAHVVPKTEAEKQLFFDINYTGTVNLCKGLEKTKIPSTFIFISTVAVYGCEEGKNITEDFPLTGTNPYAKSKIMAEEYLTEWCNKHHVRLTILRPTLLAGKNPPGNLGAMISGIKRNRYLSIGDGSAKKSIAMVNDLVRILPLCETKGGIYNLCDSHNPSFRELEELISLQLNKKMPVKIPYFLAASLAKIGDLLGSKAPINSLKLGKITKSLTFSNSKIIQELGFTPSDVLTHFQIQ